MAAGPPAKASTRKTLRVFAFSSVLLTASSGARAAAVCGDVNANSLVTSADALLVLKKAVGQQVTLQCPPPGLLPHTGQTLCSNAAGTSILCNGTGQDAAFQAGLAPDYVDNGDGTISDRNTGLIWEKLVRDGSLHDSSTVYTWLQALAKAVDTNSANFAGHNDWRLPNVRELHSIADLAAAGGLSINTMFAHNCAPACIAATCSCTMATNYWTSSSYQEGTAPFAWTVYFGAGGLAAPAKTDTYAARLVRGGL